MADQNRQKQNPDRSPSGNDPNRRQDNANQGTEGGRRSSNQPGETERPEKGSREGVPATDERYDAERDWTPGGRGEAPEIERPLDEDIDRPETGMPAERATARVASAAGRLPRATISTP